MAKLCNHIGYKVTLQNGLFCRFLVGLNGSYIEYKPLFDVFPVLKKRESYLEDASQESMKKLRGLSVSFIDGNSTKIPQGSGFVCLESFIQELLYERFTKKGTKTVSDFIERLLCTQSEALRCLMNSNKVLQTKVSPEVLADVKDDGALDKFTISDLIRSRAVAREWLPASTTNEHTAILGIYKGVREWESRRKDFFYRVDGMEFANGYILTLPHYKGRVTEFYMTNEQIKRVLIDVGIDGATLTDYLKCLFGQQMMHDRLNDEATKKRIYNEYKPNGDGKKKTQLINSRVIHNVFSAFNDDTSTAFCILLEKIQSYVAHNRSFFESYLGVDDNDSKNAATDTDTDKEMEVATLESVTVEPEEVKPVKLSRKKSTRKPRTKKAV